MPRKYAALLENALDADRESAPSDLDPATYFQLFAAEQVLKAYDLSTDELLDGICAGSGDGGIDAMYTFVDDRLVSERSDVRVLREGVEVEVVLLLARPVDAYEERPLETLADTLADVLDLARTRDELDASGLYSANLLAAADLARHALVTTERLRSWRRISVLYATKANAAKVDIEVRVRASRLEGQLHAALRGVGAAVEFIGARELYGRSQQARSPQLELTFESALPSDDNSYVALVALEDYCRFLRDEEGSLRRYIFDGNVRDFRGDIEVNREIATSLADTRAPQFWWLNNGVTIIASNVTAVGKTLRIESPQIVNGQQTSIAIHESFLSGNDPIPDGTGRLVLVRVIHEEDEAVRDQIIRATYSQASVATTSLYSTDEFQRLIEDYFLHEGWYYDRRKNHWKRQGKPAERIVQVAYLAQAVLAACLGEPALARAHPSALLRSDADYRRIFDPERELPVYLWAAQLQKQIDAFLRTEPDVSREEAANLRFHLTAVLVAETLGRRVDPRSPVDLERLVDGNGVASEDIRSTFARLRDVMARYRLQTGLGMDRVAKSADFAETALADHLSRGRLRLVADEAET